MTTAERKAAQKKLGVYTLQLAEAARVFIKHARSVDADLADVLEIPVDKFRGALILEIARRDGQVFRALKAKVRKR